MTEKQLREAYVNQMRAWIGLKENDKSHRVIIDTYNNHSPLPNGYKVTYTDAWCATTVSAAAIKCGFTSIIPKECSCIRMINLMKKMGIWMENDAHKPQPADIIFYDWEDSGVGDNVGTPNHVGVVEEVRGDDIYIIEGNKNDECGRRVVKINGKFIRGFGVPNFKSLATPDLPVNNEKIPYKCRVTAQNSVNIRKGSSTNTEVLGYLKHGSTITIDKVENGFAHFEGYLSSNYLS